ncbi:hypothetical protein AB1Y20_023543 [Prymnesium parvum]|uniref:Uncharacterized protein n=1 Tax=Prymnesium parvum TaxID=97485 RepID=A0AB34JF24_PRYPA
MSCLALAVLSAASAFLSPPLHATHPPPHSSAPHPSPCRLPLPGRRCSVVAREGEPLRDDELKVRFARDVGGGTKSSFRPADAAAARREGAPPPSQNELLLAEIRALQPEPLPPPPKKAPVDLNGINPLSLVLGAATYGTFSFFAWQFTLAAAEFFAEHPMDSAFYVVARLSSLARVVVVGLGALGSGVTAIAGAGQLALAVQVAIGIAKGELDPKAERVDPYGGRKKGEIEKFIGFMQGNKERDLGL